MEKQQISTPDKKTGDEVYLSPCAEVFNITLKRRILTGSELDSHEERQD